VSKFLWLAVGAIVGAAGFFLLFTMADDGPTAPTATSSTEAVPEPLITEAVPETIETIATGAAPDPAKTHSKSDTPRQDAKPSSNVSAVPAAPAGYLNGPSLQASGAGSSLPTSGIVPGPANYNDYQGLNGGSDCQQPVYDKWGNVSGFRKGNC